jgi:hypothetical protein
MPYPKQPHTKVAALGEKTILSIIYVPCTYCIINLLLQTTHNNKRQNPRKREGINHLNIHTHPSLNLCLRLLPLLTNLPPLFSSLIRPREVPHGNSEETIRTIRDTSKRNIPREERREKTKHAARFGERYVGSTANGRDEVRDSEHKESEPEPEKEEGEDDGGA